MLFGPLTFSGAAETKIVCNVERSYFFGISGDAKWVTTGGTIWAQLALYSAILLQNVCRSKVDGEQMKLPSHVLKTTTTEKPSIWQSEVRVWFSQVGNLNTSSRGSTYRAQRTLRRLSSPSTRAWRSDIAGHWQLSWSGITLSPWSYQ